MATELSLYLTSGLTALTNEAWVSHVKFGMETDHTPALQILY
jgi:hypothetical protein